MSSGYSQVLKAESSTETIYYTRGFELISRRTGSGASYYLFDGGMSVRGIADEEGNLTDTLVFDAFGNEVERSGSTENVYGFQGEEQDETGLYYLRARYMDPTTGTFTSMDTYGGNLEDPMSLHKYLFANSNPVKWCDPSGHMSLMEEDTVSGIICKFMKISYDCIIKSIVQPEKYGLIKSCISLSQTLIKSSLIDGDSTKDTLMKMDICILISAIFDILTSLFEVEGLIATAVMIILSIVFVPIGFALTIKAEEISNGIASEVVGNFGDSIRSPFMEILPYNIGDMFEMMYDMLS